MALNFEEHWLEYFLGLTLSLVCLALMVSNIFPKGAFLMAVLGFILGTEAAWYGAPYSFISIIVILLGIPLLYFNIQAYIFYVALYTIGYYFGYRGLLQRFKK